MLVPHHSHFGAFYAEVQNGRFVGVKPFERDPDPSRLIEALPAAVYSPARIAQPMQRESGAHLHVVVRIVGKLRDFGIGRAKLDLPGGLAWIWWGVRTNFTNPGKVKRRLENLSRAISKLKFYDGAVSARVRSKRRPSISCQPIKPGMPKPSSRTLAIKERAKAVSPGIPRRLPTRR